jgi:uncharacterized membrane protein YidH (DUF202 family)
MTRRPGTPAEPAGPTGPDPEDTDPEDTDPGLFRERTELAWQRTGIAFAALGGAVLKTAPVVGSLILAGSVSIFVLARTSRLRHGGGEAGQRRSLLVITVAVTALSLVALVLAFFPGDHPLPPSGDPHPDLRSAPGTAAIPSIGGVR